MTDRPILFSAPMVRALLAGRKTQTRRVIDFPGVKDVIDFVRVGFDRDSGVPFYEMKDARGQHLTRPQGKHFVTPHWSPRYAVGDRLYVREAWRCNGWATDVATMMYRASEGDGYTAMTEQYRVEGKKPLRVTGTWHPGLHLPRWASRITLPVGEVRVQRLQDISAADAEAEGVFRHVAAHSLDKVFRGERAATAIAYYRELWDKLNDARGFCWKTNPWVVAVSFSVEHRNVDAPAP